jgi:hypothetical protein
MLMRKLLADRRPSPALVIACIALFAAIGGTSIALPGSNSIDKNDLRKGVVKNKNIAKNAVTSSKIKNGTVRPADLHNNSVTTAKLRNGAVTNGKLANRSVGGENLTASVVRTADSPPTADADGTTNGGAVGVATATATCNTGERMLSGGATWVGNNLTPATTKPLFLRESHATANGWTAVGNVDWGAQGQAVLRVSVVCLR